MTRHSNIPAERYFHQNAPHHVTVDQEKKLNFFEIQVQLRKTLGFSLNPKIEKQSDQAAILRSQIWTGKNMSREGWA